jgi:hypothetical protein
MAKIHAAPAPRKPEAVTARSFEAIAELIRGIVREELRAAQDDDAGDPWVDQNESPLGRREHCRLARDGAFPARKVGKRWLARRSALDAFIEAHPTAKADGAPANDTAASVLAEVGIELVRGRR